MIVEVYQKSIFFDKFSSINQPEFRDINVTDGPNGKFEIYLNADNTTNGKIGRDIFAEIKTQIVNANFDSGTEDKSTGAILLGKLLATQLENDTFVP